MKIKNTPSFVATLIFSLGFFLSFTNSSYGQYCLPTTAPLLYTNTCTVGSINFIKNVSIAGTTLNNTTLCSSNIVGAPSVSVFPPTGSTTGALQQGMTYLLSVTTSDASIISVWIDYNHNSLFDASEWTSVAVASTPNIPSTVAITIPFTALTGTTGMRIRTRDDQQPNAAIDACTTGWLSGELEQYTITINAAPVCSGVPNAGTTISTLDTVCPTTNFVLSLQGADIAQGLTQQWQSSPNGTSWTNISGAVNTTLSTTQFTNTFYKCLVTCSGNTSSSTPIFIHMLVPEYYNFGTSGTIYSEGFESWIDACDNNDVPSENWINTPISGNESWRKQNEGFSTGNWTFPNPGFTLVPHAGSGAASFHTFSGNGLPGTLDLYLNGSTFSTMKLDFWYFKNQNGFDKFEVYFSRNGGFTFDDTLLTLQNNTPGQWGFVWLNQVINNIPVNNSSTCIIRFKDFGDIFGTNDTGLDDVRIDGILGSESVVSNISNVSIFPNPSDGRIEINYKGKANIKTKLNLIDFTGRVVYSEEIQQNNSFWTQSMDWSEMAKGIYFVQLVSDNQTYSQKIIIK